MEWTDIQITVPARFADTAEAVATMVSNGGIYIEDYRDLEQQAWEIAHVDLIEQELLDKPRDIVKVHMYLAPDENPAEILPLFRERLDNSGIEYTLETSGVEQEDWQKPVMGTRVPAPALAASFWYQPGTVTTAERNTSEMLVRVPARSLSYHIR